MSPRFLLLICAIVAPVAARADFVLSHSGYLLDASDHALDVAAQPIAFRVLDASAAPVWQASCSVKVSAGYYALTLGEDCGVPFTIAMLPPGADRTLEVSVGGVALSPRVRLGAAPSAGHAEHALDSDTLGQHPPSYFATATHTHAAGAITGLATVATSGAYGDLSARPSLGSAAALDAGAGAGNVPQIGVGGGLSIGGVVESTSGGFKFPDGTTQTTAAAGGDWATAGGNLTYTGGNVGIGSASPGQKLTVAGVVESTTGGFRFPDGTVQTTAGGGVAGASSGADANTTLLLHLDGSASDSSAGNVAMSSTGVTYSTTIVKYGSHAGSFNGTSNWLQGPTGATTQFAGDFTVDLWIHPTAFPAASAWRVFFDTRLSVDVGGVYLSLYGNAGQVQVGNNAAIINSTANVALNTWTHVALVRAGSTMTLYLNGAAAGTATNATNFSSGVLAIGRESSGVHGQYFQGYLDELRVSRGIARWTAPFTPPTQAWGGAGWVASGSNVYLANGRVGVGTTGPSTALDVNDANVANVHRSTFMNATVLGSEGRLQLIGEDAGVNASALVLSNAPATGNNKHWVLHHKATGGGDVLGLGYYASTATGQDVAALATYHVTFDPAGNVGIGSATPGARLDVSGPVRLGASGSTFGRIFAEDVLVDPPTIAANSQWQYTGNVQCTLIGTRQPRPQNGGTILWGDMPEKTNSTIWYHVWGASGAQDHSYRFWVINNGASPYDPPAQTVRFWQICE